MFHGQRYRTFHFIAHSGKLAPPSPDGRVFLTTASVLLAYGVAIGYQLLIGCNLVTISGTVYLEYKNFKKRSG